MWTFREYIFTYKSVKKASNKGNTPKRTKEKWKPSMKGKKLQTLNGFKTQNS